MLPAHCISPNFVTHGESTRRHICLLLIPSFAPLLESTKESNPGTQSILGSLEFVHGIPLTMLLGLAMTNGFNWPLWAPISIKHLLVLHCALNLSTPFHAAIWAITLCAFFGCCRLGELMVTTTAAFDEKYNVLCSVMITFHKLHDGSSSANFHIPWPKMTKELGASIILTAHNNILCPVAALNHLTINSPTDHSTSLFTYTTTSCVSKFLLKHEFLNFCTQIWSSALLAYVLGHRFHIGGAVKHLLTSVPPDIVTATGG